jgi:hypothetical protein
LALDFSDEETPQVTCRSSATDNLEATAHATGQIESEHLRVARRRSVKTIGGQSCRWALGNRWKALPTF